MKHKMYYREIAEREIDTFIGGSVGENSGSGWRGETHECAGGTCASV